MLKKGNATLVENYRPVSCLPAASKLLEMIVCEQMTDHLEANNMLPESQHGFRRKRSTMTAWAQIQQEWAKSTEENKITGVLLWDLSAAFDCLDIDLLCKKLEIYGFEELTVKWFSSFLSNRSQRVRIGEAISNKIDLKSGVPQGGVCSVERTTPQLMFHKEMYTKRLLT